jgi:serpin B
MRKMNVFLSAFLLSALIPTHTVFSGGSTGNPPRIPTESEQRSDELVNSIDPNLFHANTRFAFDILQELVSEDRGQNVFISPLSILLALAMTYNGAAEDTKLAIAEALEFSEFDMEALNRGFKALLDSVVTADREVEVSIANSIWYMQGCEVREDFIQRNKTYYNSEVLSLDFNDPGAADAINTWIDDATRGEIERVIDSIPPDVVMYLVNAIYFKGDWTHQFSESSTREEEFTLENGGRKMVPMMHVKKQFRHALVDNLGFLRLPYGREKLAMYILLPDEGEDLDAIVARLDIDSWNKLRSELEEKDVALTMPRYRIEYGVRDLKDVLIRMGMGIAFEPQADFSGINPELFISRILHKAVVEVNEQGSEAAAATAVEMTKGIPSEPVDFAVDRPFLFTISDDRTGSILFMGKVVDP